MVKYSESGVYMHLDQEKRIDFWGTLNSSLKHLGQELDQE